MTSAEEPPRAPPRTRISHDEYHQFCDQTLECMTAWYKCRMTSRFLICNTKRLATVIFHCFLSAKSLPDYDTNRELFVFQILNVIFIRFIYLVLLMLIVLTLKNFIPIYVLSIGFESSAFHVWSLYSFQYYRICFMFKL